MYVYTLTYIHVTNNKIIRGHEFEREKGGVNGRVWSEEEGRVL